VTEATAAIIEDNAPNNHSAEYSNSSTNFETLEGLGPVPSEEINSSEIDSNPISFNLPPHPLQQDSCIGTEWNGVLQSFEIAADYFGAYRSGGTNPKTERLII
jgi:hypothetical protein